MTLIILFYLTNISSIGRINPKNYTKSRNRMNIREINQKAEVPIGRNNTPIEKLKHMKSLFNIGVTFLKLPTYSKKIQKRAFLLKQINYPLSYSVPVRERMVLHFYQQQESSTTKTVHKVINRGLKAYV